MYTVYVYIDIYIPIPIHIHIHIHVHLHIHIHIRIHVHIHIHCVFLRVETVSASGLGDGSKIAFSVVMFLPVSLPPLTAVLTVRCTYREPYKALRLDIDVASLLVLFSSSFGRD